MMAARSLLLAVVLAALVGCAVFRAPARGLPPPPAVSEEAFEYRLLSGDRLLVKFLYTPQLSEEVLVRPDGKFVLSAIGEVVAGGRTTAELAKELARRYEPVLERPEVSLQVREFGGQRVYVGGEVRNPRMLPLDSVMSVADAVFAAGGLIDTAAADSVVLLRRGLNGGKPQAFRVDLDAGLFGETDIPRLQSYDVVFVPKTRIAQLDQYVEQYINRLIPRSASFGATYGIGF